MMENNNYGALNNDQETSVPGKRHRFDISEPSYHSRSKNLLCCHKSGAETDGFKIIVISMFVFAVGVTVALIITIASEPAPIVHFADVVTSDNAICSTAGQNVLQEGGNAVDAAVASSLCLALTEPHLTGIGGGGLMLIHSHRKNTSTVIDFRETAPENARNDRYIENPRSASLGRNSIGVPGFLKGLEYAHDKYGSGHIGLHCCSWSDLVWKALKEVLKGVKITPHFLNATQTKISQDELESNDAQWLQEFIGQAHQQAYFNDISMYKKLIDSMKMIAQNGSKVLYEGGQLGLNMIQDLGGGILTLKDLKEYKVKESQPYIGKIGSHHVMVSPSPSSGPELLAFLNTLEYMNKTNGNFGAVTADYLHTLTNVLENLEDWQLRLGDSNQEDIENTVKYMLDKNNAPNWTSDIQGHTLLTSDPNYALSDPVAANVAVMDKKDNYVSVVTSINTWFGSKIMTRDGLLLNNAMANFAIPNESGDLLTANQLAKGRRPLTANVVALTMDTKDICGSRIVTGGATASSVGQVLAFPLLLNSDLRSSVNSARLGVQNSTVFVEIADTKGSFNAKVLADFQTMDDVHKVQLPYTSVNVVEKNIDQPIKIDDFRSGGNDFIDEKYFI